MSILVIDVGTSGVRAAVVRPDATVAVEHRREVAARLPDGRPGRVRRRRPGRRRPRLARRAPGRGRPGRRRRHHQPAGLDRRVGPRHRRAGRSRPRAGRTCARSATASCCRPRASASPRTSRPPRSRHLLDPADPDRTRDLCFGTVDTWIVWHLTEGAVHVTDLSNAARHRPASTATAQGWDDRSSRRCASRGRPADHRRLHGRHRPRPPPWTAPRPSPASPATSRRRCWARAASRPGPAKITFGTGGMLDVVVGPDRPTFETRGGGGTFPIVAWRRDGAITWGLEAIMLSAGTNVEWLRDDLGIIDHVAESHDVAAPCESTDGVVYVPALLGLGTPQWDYGARGALLGLTRGTEARQVVRAVLEGVAQRGADLVDAAESRRRLHHRRAARRRRHDRNPTFVQAARRRHPASGRGLPGARGHDPRRRLPRRPGPRHLGRPRRHRRHLVARASASSRATPSTATAGATPSTGPRAGTRTSPPSTSERQSLRRPAA